SRRTGPDPSIRSAQENLVGRKRRVFRQPPNATAARGVSWPVHRQAEKQTVVSWPVHRQAEKQTVIGRDGPPVNILGGHKFPGAPAVDLCRSKKSLEIIHPHITAEEIPAFLRRGGQ